MGNHKRGKPKSSRAGCLLCKWHKHQAFTGVVATRRMQVRKQVAVAKEQIREIKE